MNLGIAYSGNGQDSAALQAYQKALSIDPNMSATYDYIGVLYNRMGRHQEAAEIYRKITQRSSQNG